MKKYVFDTNSLIYALNDKVKIPLNDYLISIITEIELLAYSELTEYEEKIIRGMLSKFKIIGLNANVKEKTIEIRKQHKLKLPDSIIVATAIENNAVLVTSDKQLLQLNILDTIELKHIIL